MYKETQTYKNLVNQKADNFPEWYIIHHSGGTDANPLADTSHHTAQIMESYHISKGWNGLGYQFVIHKNGEIWQGRPTHVQGAHTIGYNTKSIGICLAGNFDATMPTKEQIDSLKALLLDLKSKYPNITDDKIVPHRKFATKTCYGNKLTDDWARNLLKVTTPPEEPMVKIPKRLADELKKYLG